MILVDNQVSTMLIYKLSKHFGGVPPKCITTIWFCEKLAYYHPSNPLIYGLKI